MGKLIALFVSAAVFLAGIILTAFNVGVGILLLIVGLMAMIASGIMVITSGGYRTEGFFNLGWKNSPVQKVNIQKKQSDAPFNIWDEMTAGQSENQTEKEDQ